MLFVVNLNIELNTRPCVWDSLCGYILASLYVTRKRSRLISVQSSITGLYGVRHSPLLLLTLGNSVHVPLADMDLLYSCTFH